MKEIAAADFKGHCLVSLDQLDFDDLVITKDGRPIAHVAPFNPQFNDLKRSDRESAP